MIDRTYPHHLTGSKSPFSSTPEYGPYTRHLTEEKLHASMNANQHHIMLLTKEEAYDVLECFGEFGRNDSVLEEGFLNLTRDETLDYLGQSAIYSGNAKDLYSAADLVRKLGGFGIAAVVYVGRSGEKLIKITGYPGIRRILNGTRYKLNNMQIVKIGLGNTGINNSIVQGMRWNIYVSLAYRSIELIFRDESSTADFLGNITVDIAKTIVMAAGTRAFSSLIVMSAAVSIGATFLTVAVVLVIVTFALNEIDKEFGITDKIIEKIKELELRSPGVADSLGMNSQLLNKKI